MKVLSVKNPWAFLIIHYGKTIENRSRKTTYRGRIAIHASKESDSAAWLLTPSDPEMKAAFDAIRERRAEIESLNGKILGTVDLYNCSYPALTKIVIPENPWWEPDSPWHYWLQKPEALAEPIPARGMLGLWNYDGL